MNVDICWVKEDLLAREPPHVVEEHPHGYLILPVRRNLLDDGYVFVVRLSSGDRRPHVGDPPEPLRYPFEQRLRWQSSRGGQTSIIKFHNLFPVKTEAITFLRGRGFLDEPALAEATRSIAGLLWDEGAARDLMREPSTAKLVPGAARAAQPGDIVTVDGAPAVVVSSATLHQWHHFGTLSLVPLIEATSPTATERVAIGSLVAAPEFLKTCQVVDGVQTIRPDGRRFATPSLDQLLAQVRELLEWGETSPPGFATGTVGHPTLSDATHPCLFSNRPRPWRTGIPRNVPLPLGYPVAGTNGPFEPTQLDAVRFKGSQGDLRVELWDREGVIGLELVTESGRLQVIDMLSIMTDDGFLNIARGPLVPQDWAVSQTLGPVSALEGRVIEVSVRAPGIAEEYTFQLDRTDA